MEALSFTGIAIVLLVLYVIRYKARSSDQSAVANVSRVVSSTSGILVDACEYSRAHLKATSNAALENMAKDLKLSREEDGITREEIQTEVMLLLSTDYINPVKPTTKAKETV